jgi:Zinc metalloprotease (elastase)
MSHKNYSKHRVSISLSVAVALFASAMLYAPAFFSSRASGRSTAVNHKALENYDIRLDTKAANKMAGFRARSGRSAVAVADARDEFVRGESALKQRVPTLRVQYNDRLQIPEIIGPDPTKGRGSLVGQINSSRAETLRGFARDNASLVGVSNSQADDLKATADYTNPNGELSYSRLEQHINGIPVFQGEIQAGFNKHGEMFRVVNNLAPGLDYGSISTDFGDVTQAVQAAAGNLGIKPGSIDMSENAAMADDQKKTFGNGDWPTTAEKMYFPTEPGVAVPAWRVLSGSRPTLITLSSMRRPEQFSGGKISQTTRHRPQPTMSTPPTTTSVRRWTARRRAIRSPARSIRP